MTALRRILLPLALLLLLLAMGRFLDDHRRQLDLTADDSLTLSDQTLRVLSRLDRNVRLTAVLSRDDPTRVNAASLLNRYRRANRRITFRVLDPLESRGEVQRLGVDPLMGGLVATAGDEREHAPTVSEQDVTAALARLVRGGSAELCVTAGHGEADVASTLPDGLSEAAAMLEAGGYSLRTIDLVATADIPDSCEGLLVPGPTSPFGPAEAAVGEWLAAGGRALFLLDPVADVGLRPVLEPLGLRVDRGIVLEGDPEARLPGDPVSVVVRDFPSGNPIVRRLPPVLFPGTQGLTVTDERPQGGSAFVVARSTPLGYLERQPAQPAFDPVEDGPGPIAVGVVSDISRVTDGRVHRTRVAVFADADFATNVFLGEAGNAQLLAQAVDWVTLDEDLVSVSPNLARPRPLLLTEGRLRYARMLMSGIVPALFLVLGTMVWVARRPR